MAGPIWRGLGKQQGNQSWSGWVGTSRPDLGSQRRGGQQGMVVQSREGGQQAQSRPAGEGVITLTYSLEWSHVRLTETIDKRSLEWHNFKLPKATYRCLGAALCKSSWIKVPWVSATSTPAYPPLHLSVGSGRMADLTRVNFACNSHFKGALQLCPCVISRLKSTFRGPIMRKM